jgi:hypothetical protein
VADPPIKQASFKRLMLKQQGMRTTWEYPFAVAGVNISYMLIQLLELNSGMHVNHSRRTKRIFFLCGWAWHLISTCETVQLPRINKNSHVSSDLFWSKALIKAVIRVRSPPCMCIAFVRVKRPPHHHCAGTLQV